MHHVSMPPSSPSSLQVHLNLQILPASVAHAIVLCRGPPQPPCPSPLPPVWPSPSAARKDLVPCMREHAVALPDAKMPRATRRHRCACPLLPSLQHTVVHCTHPSMHLTIRYQIAFRREARNEPGFELTKSSTGQESRLQPRSTLGLPAYTTSTNLKKMTSKTRRARPQQVKIQMFGALSS